MDVVIEGETQNPIRCEIKFIIKKIDGTPMASLMEGRYTDKLYTFKPGPFEIVKHIRLPKYLANGNYLIDLDLYQPSTFDFFRARNCANLHIEGFFDPFTRSLILNKEGFVGLESE